MIVLIGFMGAGKSCVGMLLAERLGIPFLDSDRVITAQSGQSIPQLFAQSGEAGFRRLEAATIKELLSRGEGVLALGGGAVITAEVRDALAGHQVVFLEVSLAQALARVGSDCDRPMLARADLDQLFASRQQFYAEAATLTVPAGGSPAFVVAAVLEALGMGE